MKEFKALQSVINTLGVQAMNNNVAFEGIDKAFYSINISSDEVTLQGAFASNIAGWIVRKFPNSTTSISDYGNVYIYFEHENVRFRVVFC
jgi:hypothetical protein